MNAKENVLSRYPQAVVEKNYAFGFPAPFGVTFAVFTRPRNPKHPGRGLLGLGKNDQEAWTDAQRYIHRAKP